MPPMMLMINTTGSGRRSCSFHEVVFQTTCCPGGEPAEGDGGGREKQGECESCEIQGATQSLGDDAVLDDDGAELGHPVGPGNVGTGVG